MSAAAAAALLALALLALPGMAAAQAPAGPAPAPTEFPEGAEPIDATAIRERLAGRIARVRLANGSTWRLDYKASGYVYIDTSDGFRDTGQWRVENGKLCGEWRRAPSGCNEVRAKGEAIYLKRGSGEVIALTTSP